MRRPQSALKHLGAEAAHAVRDPFGQHGKSFRDGRRAPVGDHLHADRGHLQRNEMIALAHVETPGVADIGQVGEIDLVLGAHVAAGGCRLLERDAVLMAFGDIEKGAAVGSDQPFVGREQHEIRIEAFDVHRQHAGALGRVDQEEGAMLPQRRGDLFEVDQPAVRPVHRRDRCEADGRSAGSFDHRENRRGPVAVTGLANCLDRKALRFGAMMPFQHRRGMIVFQQDHTAAPRDRYELRGSRDAVADRGDQGDVGGIGIDQAGSGGAGAFVLASRKIGVERPGSALATDRGAAGLQGSQRQRAVGGRVEVADLARHIEPFALRRQHICLYPPP